MAKRPSKRSALDHSDDGGAAAERENLAIRQRRNKFADSPEERERLTELIRQRLARPREIAKPELFSLPYRDKSGAPDSLSEDNEWSELSEFADGGETIPQQDRIRIARRLLVNVTDDSRRLLANHMKLSALLFIAHKEIWANPDIPADQRLDKLIEEAERYGLRYRRTVLLEYERLHVLRSEIWLKCQADEAIATAKGLAYEFPAWQKALLPFKAKSKAKAKAEPKATAPDVDSEAIAQKALADLEEARAELKREHDRILDFETKSGMLARKLAEIKEIVESGGDDMGSMILRITYIVADAPDDPQRDVGDLADTAPTHASKSKRKSKVKNERAT